MNVLIIEDNPSHLKLARLVLNAAGHAVNDAGAGDEALAAIEKEKPQVILLDLSLPGIDGLSLVRNLKSNPATADIPVVAVTAHPEMWSRKAALEAGCSVYLVKPINTRTLPSEVVGACGAKPPAEQT